MSRNGSGVASKPANTTAVAGELVEAAEYNTLADDIYTELTDSLCRSGKGAALANISWGNNKITSLGPGTAATDAANLSQVWSGAGYADKTTAEGETIPAAIKVLRLSTWSGTANGYSGARYKRVSALPSHSMYFRSTDRFMPDGSTDNTNGGYWEFAEQVINPFQGGAVGNFSAVVEAEMTDDGPAFVRIASIGRDIEIPVTLPVTETFDYSAASGPTKHDYKIIDGFIVKKGVNVRGVGGLPRIFLVGSGGALKNYSQGGYGIQPLGYNRIENLVGTTRWDVVNLHIGFAFVFCGEFVAQPKSGVTWTNTGNAATSTVPDVDDTEKYEYIHHKNIHVYGRTSDNGAAANLAAHAFDAWGYCENITYEDCTAHGTALNYAFSSHWSVPYGRLTTTGHSYYVAGWSPGKIKYIRCAAYDLDAGSNGFTCSGIHDFTYEDCLMQSVAEGMTIKVGDGGGGVMINVDEERVMSGIVVNRAKWKGCTGYGVLVSGLSYDDNPLQVPWVGSDHQTSVYINGTYERGSVDQDNYCASLTYFNNVVFDVDIIHPESLSTVDDDSGAAVDAAKVAVSVSYCRNVTLAGHWNVTRGFRLNNVIGCNVENLHCTSPTDIPGYVWGATTFGGLLSAPRKTKHVDNTTNITLTANATAGATSIALSQIPAPMVKGSRILIGSDILVVTAAVAVATGGAAAGSVSVAPIPNNLTSGTAVTLEQSVRDVVISGSSFTGYFYGLNVGSASTVPVHQVKIIGCTFSHNGQFDVLTEAVDGLAIIGSTFRESNQSNNASGCNLRFSSPSATVYNQNISIVANTFEENGGPTSKVLHNIYPHATAHGLTITGNNFVRYDTSKANSAAIRIDAQDAAVYSQPRPVFDNNTFGSAVTNAFYPTTGIPRGARIGDRFFGYNDAAPVAGTWKAGDIIWDETPSASTVAGWFCTAGGSPGTWKAFTTLAA